MDIAKVERVYTSYSGVYDHIFGKIFHESREACVRNLRIRPEEKILEVGVGTGSRRDFLKFCSTMAATLALPSNMVPTIAEAFEKKQKPYVVWLEFSDCAGDSESILRAAHPTIADVVLDIISLEYHETIMAGSGAYAEKALHDVVKNHKGKYIAVVEGAMPMNDGGIYCTVAGKTALDIAREVCGSAAMTLAVGSCSSWGGVASAKPNPTGCVGVGQAVPGITYVNLPGCPHNPENTTAVIVH